MTGPESLHHRLKIATTDLHQAAEQALGVENRLSSLDGYVELLERLWSLHAGLERGLTAHSRDLVGLNVEWRKRSPLLAQDLQALAGRGPQLAPVAFDYASPSAALGGLYVLEGSMLGGRVLYHQARTHLAINERNGGRFLAGHGQATASRWRSFLEALASLPPAGDAADQSEAGARATFRLIIDQLAAPASARQTSPQAVAPNVA